MITNVWQVMLPQVRYASSSLVRSHPKARPGGQRNQGAPLRLVSDRPAAVEETQEERHFDPPEGRKSWGGNQHVRPRAMDILDNVEMATRAIPPSSICLIVLCLPFGFFVRFCRGTLSAQGSRSNISSLVYQSYWTGGRLMWTMCKTPPCVNKHFSFVPAPLPPDWCIFVSGLETPQSTLKSCSSAERRRTAVALLWRSTRPRSSPSWTWPERHICLRTHSPPTGPSRWFYSRPWRRFIRRERWCLLYLVPGWQQALLSEVRLITGLALYCWPAWLSWVALRRQALGTHVQNCSSIQLLACLVVVEPALSVYLIIFFFLGWGGCSWSCMKGEGCGNKAFYQRGVFFL